MRPGREHDTTALRAHAEALPLLAEWADAEYGALADLGYEGVRGVLITPVQRIAGRALVTNQRILNALHGGICAPAKRGNSLLKATFMALRRVSCCPWRIGAITAAALVVLHHQHGRTTGSLTRLSRYWERLTEHYELALHLLGLVGWARRRSPLGLGTGNLGRGVGVGARKRNRLLRRGLDLWRVLQPGAQQR